LIDCGAAGRVFGAPIGLPDWNKVLATPGRQSASSLDDELKIEMERVTHDIFWDSPESGLDRTNNDPLLLRNLVATLDEWVSSRPAPKRTLRRLVLERLEEAGPKGSKAGAIRDYATANLQCDFTIRRLGWPSTALPKKGVRVGQAKFGSAFGRDCRWRTSAQLRFRGLEPRLTNAKTSFCWFLGSG
jgi:hypothetical protein